MVEHARLPEWLRRAAPDPSILVRMKDLLNGLQLYTVCESADCPNQGECFAHGTATFMPDMSTEYRRPTATMFGVCVV